MVTYKTLFSSPLTNLEKNNGTKKQIRNGNSKHS